MKNKFLSKSVPRGTRTIWRYLGALFILFTFAIGNAWAADVAKISFNNDGAVTTYGATKVTATNSNVGKVNVSWADFSLTTAYVTSTSSKEACISLANSVADAFNTKHVQFSSADVITKVELLASIPGSTSAANEVICGWSGTPSATPDTIIIISIPGKGTTTLTAIDFPVLKGIKYVRCYRQPKFKDGKFDSKGTQTGSSTTWAIAYAQVTTNPSCSEPETDLSLSSDAPATIYAGTEITFSTSGGNGGDITIEGAASEDIQDNKWTATEGEHTFTASQAKNGNVCAQEAELKLTVLAATPVSTVTVNGPANGYKNNKVIFAATAANATQYRWTIDGVAQGSDSAKLYFTPTESKTYSIVCEARNSFNETGEWISSSAHSYAVTSLYGELVRATLTGGNNATMTGIIGGTFDSNLGSGKYKLDNDKYMGVQLASGTFQEGDTVIVNMTTAGSNYPCLFVDKDRNTLLYLATETSSALEYKMVLPAAVNNKNTVYLSRHDDDYKWNPVVKYISVVRPMPVKSTTEALVGASFNGTALTAAQVATLLADHTLALTEALADAPTAVFTKQVTYTYEDNSQKQANVDVDAVVTVVSTNWQAKATINSIDYTITTPKASSAKVYYYDGATKIGEETVAINGNPAEYEAAQGGRKLATFNAWYSKSDLSGDPVNIASAVITKDTTFYASFTNRYATSVNIEKLVMQNGKSYGLMAQMGAQNYASNITGSLDSLSVKADSLRNYSYLGLKVKQSGGMLDFRLAKDNTVKIKFGNVATIPHVKINGGDYAAMTITDKVYSYTAEEDAYISIKMMSGDAVVFQQIMIGEDFQAPELYPINYADAENGAISGLKLGIPGETIKVYPVPAEGYVVESVTVNENAITPAENVYSFTMPSAAANVVATFGIYVPPTFSVTYMPNGGTGAEFVIDDNATVIADNMFTAPASSIFAGWKDADNNDVEVGAAVTEDLVLYAQWRSYFTITYMDGDDVLDTEDVFEGDAPVGIADPVKAMNTFKGWTLAGSDEVIDVTALTEATTVYAKWEAIDACYYFAAKSVTESEAISADAEINTTYGGTLVAKTSNISYETLGVLVASSGNTYVTANLDYAMTEGTSIKVVLAAGGTGSRGVNLCVADQKSGSVMGMTWSATVSGEEKEFTYTLDANSALKDKKTFSLYRTGNVYIKSITVKDCAPEQYTVTYMDGENTLGTEQVYENEHPTAVGIATYKQGYVFQGWKETVDGPVVDMNTITITAAKDLFAEYAEIDCSGAGSKYQFQFKTDLTSGNLPASNHADMSEYVDQSDGGALFFTSASAGQGKIVGDTAIQFTNVAAYLKVELGCALAAGDRIRIRAYGNPIRVQVGTSYDEDKDLQIAKNDFGWKEITSAMEGVDDLYLTRASNGNATLVYFEVYRPAKFDVSFDMMGHGSAIADIEDVLEGSKITAPTAPTDENFAFAGWYKENTLENEWDFANDVVSAATTLYAKWLDKSDATLKSLKYGDTDIELQAGIYEYNVELPALTTAVPALTAVANSPLADAVATDADAFDGEGHATSIVTVTPAVGAAQIYTVNFSKAAALPQVNVTEATTWDWSLAGSTSMENQHNVVLANVPGITNDNTFNSQALKGTFNKLAVGYFQGSVLSFTTEVDGKLTITFRGTNNNTRHMQVCVGDGETVIADWEYKGSGDAAQQTKSIYVPVGKVTLKAFEGENAQNVRIYNMDLSTADNYHRTVNPSYLGTLCWTNNAVLGGATLYEFAGKNENNYLVFDEVAENRLEAGKPYIFMPENGNTQIKVYNTDNEAALTEDQDPVNNMYGTITGKTLVPGQDDNMYYFSASHIWAVKDFTVEITIPAYYCYVDYQAVLAGAPAAAPAPGRRRVTMGVQGEQVATGVEQIANDQLPIKVLINGQLFILRGEKMFNANGQLVK